MNDTTSIESRIGKVIDRFLECLGRQRVSLHSNSDLHKDAGISSDEGVMLVLDLCDEFQIQLPDDFNAIVHDNGKRGRKFKELVGKIENSVQPQEATL